MKEYSHSYDDPKKQIPYYAIINDQNNAHYERYLALTKPLANFYPLVVWPSIVTTIWTSSSAARLRLADQLAG